MSEIFDQEHLLDRANDLVTHNGIKQAFVSLDMAIPASFAWVQIECYNSIALADILSDVSAALISPDDIFGIAGGTRVRGDLDGGNIRVTEIVAGTNSHSLELKIEPVGDYSTYQLNVIATAYAFDPLFRMQGFKFRPGCFNTNCAPLSDYSEANDEPLIDYLAKDFHSFRHILFNAMRERVPDWQPTSEADLDNVLIGLIAADADELSDYQDRVVTEAYLGRARKRTSLARHGRLMDYHLHQGNQASSWLALQLNTDVILDRSLAVWSGLDWQSTGAVIFASRHHADSTQALFAQLNTLKLYTWGNTVRALEAGATQADVISPDGVMTEAEADLLRDLFRHADVTQLLIEQKLNPDTASINGLDKTARQIVRLLEGNNAAESIEDPVLGTWFVRVFWQEADYTRRRFCFVTEVSGQPPSDEVTLFHGNLVEVFHGRPHRTHFLPAGSPLGNDDDSQVTKLSYHHYLPGDNVQLLRSKSAAASNEEPGIALTIPDKTVSYLDTEPGGEQAPKSSISIAVSGFSAEWSERNDLIESDEADTHFVVDTDETGKSTILFGNNINGRALPEQSLVTCHYQVGRGAEGNIGPDSLKSFDQSATGFPAITHLWNPLDITNGRDPEGREQAIRRIPQAYRARQLRAITLEDYVDRAESLEAVSHAYASYRWTGSWRTVRVAIDLKAGFSWEQERQEIKAHLDAVRLIGEDLEIRNATFVSLDIYLKICAHAGYWPEDLRHVLETEFSNGYTADGRMGFFHPDLWTFGQSLHASQIMGRALNVEGTDRVILLNLRRWYSVTGPSTGNLFLSPADLAGTEEQLISVEPDEIIQVASDPSHLEKGRIQIEIVGGRQ